MLLNTAGLILPFCILPFFQNSQCFGQNYNHFFLSYRLLLIIQATKHNNTKDHQFINSPVEEHSKKPDVTRDKIIELAGDLPRVELFA